METYTGGVYAQFKRGPITQKMPKLASGTGDAYG